MSLFEGTAVERVLVKAIWGLRMVAFLLPCPFLVTLSTDEASVGFWFRVLAAKPEMADASAEALTVTCAAYAVRGNAIMQDYMRRMPRWVEPTRPRATGNARRALALGIANCLSNRRIAPLNQRVSLVLGLAPFDARLPRFCGGAYLWSGGAQTSLISSKSAFAVGNLGRSSLQATEALQPGGAVGTTQISYDTQRRGTQDAGQSPNALFGKGRRVCNAGRDRPRSASSPRRGILGRVTRLLCRAAPQHQHPPVQHHSGSFYETTGGPT